MTELRFVHVMHFLLIPPPGPEDIWTNTTPHFVFLYTFGSAPLTGDQPAPMPLPTQVKANSTEAASLTSSVIRTHDPSVGAWKTTPASHRTSNLMSTKVCNIKLPMRSLTNAVRISAYLRSCLFTKYAQLGIHSIWFTEYLVHRQCSIHVFWEVRGLSLYLGYCYHE